MNNNPVSIVRSFLLRVERTVSTIYFSSSKYWESRYVAGGNSGAGSYSHLAKFKAEILNKFVSEHNVRCVIEFGCGDGNQLTLSQYPSYEGYDISPEAVNICRKKFQSDTTKKFGLLPAHSHSQADLSISLDVIYHLVEDSVFEQHMKYLFDASMRYVVIYSSDIDVTPPNCPKHIKHRRFTNWVSSNRPEWNLVKTIPNDYPDNGDHSQTTFADFYFYSRN